jgi:hypothetical protein
MRSGAPADVEMAERNYLSRYGAGVLAICSDLVWRAVWDDFRNWLALGLQPAKGNENRGIGQNVGAGSGEIEISHGAIEAEQLFDPERA